MRKGIAFKKLSRNTNERKQLLRNLIRSMAMRGYMETTRTKAKFLQPNLEKLVTVAKKNSLSSLRQLYKETGNLDVAKMLVEYGKLFSKRNGGYTRILRLGERIGDAAESVKMEWVEKLNIAPIVAKPKVVKLEKNTKVVKTEKTEKKLLKKTNKK
ncbi:MAG: 50S ribosomal protein L17 [Candidatus Gottesmanbacteria bacterium GW2011_GWA1_34_13]|uniref:50S ribosomal protein L17 n=1 Tax=Candidatus Gottesmanbacteria bacterium GW2011_GWA1_34_13 TaxID=1618434 RepID=A0A0G0DXE1_9BACT|nr:MAG: 50S ribosomal protein L17 [Candidatus Gottesmanbacteria bacterium GW2011_GWA1_34_13]